MKKNKKNFSAQPAGGGMIDTYTGLDLVTDIREEGFKKDNFQKRPLFVPNCESCGGSFKNLNGNEYGYDEGGGSGTNILGSGISWNQLFTTAANIYSQEQQQQILSETRDIQQTQAQLERQKLLQEQARAEAQKAKSRVWIPITIGISVVLVGVGAYFFFRKKPKAA